MSTTIPKHGHELFNTAYLLVVVAFQHDDWLTAGWLHLSRHTSLLAGPQLRSRHALRLAGY